MDTTTQSRIDGPEAAPSTMGESDLPIELVCIDYREMRDGYGVLGCAGNHESTNPSFARLFGPFLAAKTPMHPESFRVLVQTEYLDLDKQKHTVYPFAPVAVAGSKGGSKI